MPRLSSRLLGALATVAAGVGLPLLTGLPLLAGDVAALAEPQLVVFEPPPPRDGVSRSQAAEIDRAIAAYQRRAGATARPKDDGPPLFPFFPQAGILGADLFLNNFTDLDPANGLVRDWDCSAYTYDGHQGHDSLIRTFREQEIGVPVFAVLPGVVVATHDGEPDHNTEWDPANNANYAIIDHGGGLTTIYFHFKTGSVAVVPGQPVVPGTQLGQTGSSGVSDWPHLHLETRQDNRWLEPSAGPCRTGDSRWEAQPPVSRDPYVADAYLSRGPLFYSDFDAYLADQSPRAGSFTRGRQVVGVHVDVRNLPVLPAFNARLLDPRGNVVSATTGSLTNRTPRRLEVLYFNFDVDLDTLGTWRLSADVEGFPPIDAPFRVVASAAQLKNRKPNKVTATFTPASPRTGRAFTCAVNTSAVTEDPDYDVVAYRYEWRVAGRPVRAVTSAARTDMLAAGVAAPGQKVSCRVTPTDLKSAGPPANAVGRN